jgi:acyl-CoA-binding protein
MASAFDKAVDHVKRSDASIANTDKLKFYGHFKQATAGDCTGDAPSRFNAVAHAKWSAWNDLKGKSPEDARSDYIKLVCSVYNDFDGADPSSSKVTNAKQQKQAPVATALALKTHQGKTSTFDETSEMLATLQKKQNGKEIAYAAFVCLCVSAVGVTGFLLTILSTQALMCLGLIFAGLAGAALNLIQLHQVYGILPLYAPWLQRVLLERTMVETILDGTIVKQWMDWFAEIGPVFQCKTDEDRVAALQNMSEKTRRWITTRGVINLLP